MDVSLVICQFLMRLVVMARFLLLVSDATRVMSSTLAMVLGWDVWKTPNWNTLGSKTTAAIMRSRLEV